MVLHESPGGDLWNGYQVGNRIREENLPTAVSGKCESACALIFLSGAHRDGRRGVQHLAWSATVDGRIVYTPRFWKLCVAAALPDRAVRALTRRFSLQV